MATKREELANPNGCLNMAADDEPIFVLRANDELASIVVQYWTRVYGVDKSVKQNGVLTEKQREKIKEASQSSFQMREWRNKKGLPA